jgi:hypothetical protein
MAGDHWRICEPALRRRRHGRGCPRWFVGARHTSQHGRGGHPKPPAPSLNDRGQIAAGLRADLARIQIVRDLAAVREVYHGGQKVI